MEQKSLTRVVKTMLCIIAWMQSVRVVQSKECEDGKTATVITLREMLDMKELTAIARDAAMQNYSNIRTLPNLRMIIGCRPKTLRKKGLQRLGSADGIEDDGDVRIASWALDRLDQRELPLDHRAYDPSNCTRHHGGTVQAFVIDTGCSIGHSLFRGRRIESITVPGSGYKEGIDDNGHGTEIASLLIGQGTGVAREMKVTCIKALGRDGLGAFSDVAEAIELVVQRAKENNGEMVGRKRGMFAILSLTGMGKGEKTMDIAVQRAGKHGVVSFAAAGNQGRNACDYSPGREAIGVGAMGRGDRVADFSNWGVCVDAIGPGKGIIVADGSKGNGTEMRVVSGTSYSAPLIAGLVGLLWEGGGVEEAKEIISRGITVDQYHMPTLECDHGEGLGGTWTIIGLGGVALCLLLATVLYS